MIVRRVRSACLFVAVCAVVVGSKPAGAANFDYRGELGMGHSDNIRRVPTDEQSEDIASLGARFSFDRRSSRLTTDVVGNLAYQHYLNDTYDSEVVGTFLGNARFGIVPGRFDWVLSDSFGQVLDDPFQPATPDNRENINFLTTGPDLTLPLSSQLKAVLSGRYLLTTYEESPFDSDGVSAELSLVRALSAASALSLNARQQDITYDDRLLQSDYTQREVFLRYDGTGARTHLALDVGYSQLDRDASADKEDGVLLRLDISRRVSASSTASLSVGSEFQNAGGAFAASQSAAGVDVGAAPGRQVAQPFTNDYARLGFDFARNRTAFDVGVSHDEQTYEHDPTLDQTLSGVNATFRRQLSQQTSLTLGAFYTAGDFKISGGDYTDLNGQVIVDWQLSRALGVQARYDYFDRDSDLAAGDYKENRFWLAFTYGRGIPRASYLPPAYGMDALSRDPSAAR